MLTTWTTIPVLDRLLTDVRNDVTGTAFGTRATRPSSGAADRRLRGVGPERSARP